MVVDFAFVDVVVVALVGDLAVPTPGDSALSHERGRLHGIQRREDGLRLLAALVHPRLHQRSKPIDDLLDEARGLMAGGAFELNLIGQDTTNYGLDIGWANPDAASPEGLVGLLSRLNDIASEHGGGWIRLMYAYPTNFTDEMIDAIASLEHIVNYIDIPLQHVSDRMLTAMRRNVTGDEQRTLMERLRERIPGVAIRTTFITGFPGETEEDHEELLDWIHTKPFQQQTA